MTNFKSIIKIAINFLLIIEILFIEDFDQYIFRK